MIYIRFLKSSDPDKILSDIEISNKNFDPQKCSAPVCYDI